MLLIAHRGNINGPNIELENNPDYILNTLKLGYDCEIDVWKINNKLLLGHDKPDYKIDLNQVLTKNCSDLNHGHSKETIKY
jgi:hypothetical protein